MPQPLLSIITVTRNAAATLPATLESIASQTCRLWEYIVIDGASTDSTVPLVRASGIEPCIIVSEPDRGLYDAMNKGLAIARGDYVVFLNAGDSFHSPHTVAHIAAAILDNDYPGIVYGQTVIVDARRKVLRPRHFDAPAHLTASSFGQGMTVCHQAFVALRKLTPRYDTRYRYSADYDWCIRCLQRSHRNLYLDQVLIDYLDEGLTTAHRRRSLIERWSIMRHYYGLWHTLKVHASKAVAALLKP